MQIGHFFKNLKISKKMLLAPTIVLLFLVILFFGTYWGLSNQKTAIEDIFNNRFQTYQMSSRLMYEMAVVHSNVYKVISWAASQYEKAKVDALGKEQLDIIERNIHSLQQVLKSGHLTGEEQKLYQVSLDRLLEYQKPAKGVLEVASVDLTTGTMFMGIADGAFQNLTKSLEELLIVENKLSKNKFDFSITTYRDTLRIFVAVFLIALVVSVFISVFLSRLVSSSLEKTVAVIQKVAEGDLTQDIHLNSKDELGYLAQSVNEMRMKMRRSGGSIGGHVSNVVGGGLGAGCLSGRDIVFPGGDGLHDETERRECDRSESAYECCSGGHREGGRVHGGANRIDEGNRPSQCGHAEDCEDDR